MSENHTFKDGGAQRMLRQLGIIWNHRGASRVLATLVGHTRTQRTLQHELSMKASAVNDAIHLLEAQGYVRCWTEMGRRDKLYAANAQGLHVACMIEDLAAQNNIQDILSAGRGVPRA